MDRIEEENQPKTQEKKKKKRIKRALKVKLSKVTILAGFVTGVLVCLCLFTNLLATCKVTLNMFKICLKLA